MYKSKSLTKKNLTLSAIILSKIIGSAGIDKSYESTKVRRVGMFFNWLLLIVMIFIPIHGPTTSNSYQLSVGLALFISWFVWLAFFAETFVLTILVKKKLLYLVTNWLNLVIVVFIFPPLWKFGFFTNLNILLRIIVLINVVVPWYLGVYKLVTTNTLGLSLSVLWWLLCLVIF